MDVVKLMEIITESSAQFRKGEEAASKTLGSGLSVVDIYDMPHVDEVRPDVPMIDMVFITVGINVERALHHKVELVRILSGYPDPSRLASGPSYIEVGAVIGDQGRALQLFALGQFLGLWKVITPGNLGFKGDEIVRAAGHGMIMISGFARVDVDMETRGVDPFKDVKMTAEEVVALMKSSLNRAEWDANCNRVKKMFNGYPGFWFEYILRSGVAAETQQKWRE